MASAVIGVIGGSGLYDLPGLADVQRQVISTPFGEPSDAFVTGELGGTRMVFLPRHGAGHRISPTEINYRANVHGMKQLGVTHLISVSAVGSMKEEIAPGDLVVVDQYIDLTKRRVSTFFDEVVAHVAFADPTCALLGASLAKAAGSVHRKGEKGVHRGGAYVCIEGPHFSTRAESLIYRSWGVSVIGMTSMPEAKLAREAELPFATLALATDYDCWHDAHDDVTVAAVLATMKKNVALAKKTLAALATRLPDPAKSVAHGAARGAIMTAPDAMPPDAKARLGWLLGP